MRPSTLYVVAGFPEVMAKRTEQNSELLRSRQVINQLACFVQHKQRMRPHVPFRMPFRVLRDTPQRMFREREPRRLSDIMRFNPADGFEANSSFSNSPHTRSAGSSVNTPANVMLRHRLLRPNVMSNSKRAANCTPRSTRNGSS
jgi:hypothetical protein